MSVKFYFNFRKKSGFKSADNLSQKNGIFLEGNNGSTVILIHGLTGTPHEMSFLARFLNSRGYATLCPVLANHGEPMEVLKNTTWQECYQSVREAFMKINSGKGLIFVSGLSLGALLALLLAEEFPQRVAGVSCLSPTLFYDGWNAPWYQCFLPLASHTFLKHFSYFKEDSPYGIKNEQLRKVVHRYYNKARISDMEGVARYGYPYFPVTLLYQLRLLVRHLTKKLGYINAPVQLIQAKNDDVTSVKNSQFIYDKIKSEMKEIVLLHDSYHIITADQERDKVAEAMDSFFKRIGGDLKGA
ncbi:MAG: alpha/beta fold hydrolase [Candidatus Omnitrophica bacterium]|nr:alpha/beta fold hydrolase [Candidatus Omnitrophota bacterium]MDD5592756.1 alpha/beta fold hydrolase [Candidatus Omnitrophota bacterium]